MNFAEISLRGFVGLLRPLAGMRGAGRFCRLANRVFLNLGCPPIQPVKMRDGSTMLVDLRSQTEWWAFYSGRYDDELITLILRLLASVGGNFLDVGGNIGMYAVRVARKVPPSVSIAAFEPVPQNAERIRDNYRRNGGTLQVFEVGVSDQEGTAELVLREDFHQGSTTGNASIAISQEVDGSFAKISVPIYRFDELAKRHALRNFGIAKIDIEGHEDAFLRGASDWLHSERPIILTEVNNWFYCKRGVDISGVFASALPEGYRTALCRPRGGQVFLVEVPIRDLATLSRIESCLLFPVEKSKLIYSAIKFTSIT